MSMYRFQIERAEILFQEIRQLDEFLIDYSASWTAKLITEKQQYFLRTMPYGSKNASVYELHKDTMDKMVVFLKDELETKKKELKELFLDPESEVSV